MKVFSVEHPVSPDVENTAIKGKNKGQKSREQGKGKREWKEERERGNRKRKLKEEIQHDKIKKMKKEADN